MAITTDDILNAIYSHVKNDEFDFQCEGCGDDSRDGSVLARKEVDSLLEQVRKEEREKVIEECREQIWKKISDDNYDSDDLGGLEESMKILEKFKSSNK